MLIGRIHWIPDFLPPMGILHQHTFHLLEDGPTHAGVRQQAKYKVFVGGWGERGGLGAAHTILVGEALLIHSELLYKLTIVKNLHYAILWGCWQEHGSGARCIGW
jgi:hypothetical protein